MFRYSMPFEQAVRAFHKGKETLPQYESYIAAHLGGPGGRLEQLSRELIPEIEFHCGPLAGRRVLDFGCGTGASCVALALAGANVVGLDPDETSVALARRRVDEHGLGQRITVLSGELLDDVFSTDEEFDCVVLNGVLEHVPSSVPDARRGVLKEATRFLRPAGYLVINDTPNRLWPFDFHTTQLWLIPWTPAGSQWAYRRALSAHRFADLRRVGPVALEYAGAWGATFWEVARYLAEGEFACVNARRGHDRHVAHAANRSMKRRLLERVCRLPARLLGAPLTAFTPTLSYLVFQKLKAASVSTNAPAFCGTVVTG